MVKSGFLFLTFIGLILLGGCNYIKEDKSLCPESPVIFTFTYTRNIPGLDFFKDEVHCLELFIFDESGRFVTNHREENNEIIKDGNFSVSLKLLKGRYKAVTYGGMTCSQSSFQLLMDNHDDLRLEDLKVGLKDYYYFDDKAGTLDPYRDIEANELKLHDHFYGAKEFTVGVNNTEPVIIDMMRNTNTIHIALQTSKGDPIRVSSYQYYIEYDNNYMDWQNGLINSGDIIYRPFRKYESFIESEDPEIIKFYSAIADFSLGRLIKRNTPLLYVVKKENPEIELINALPLMEYLLKFKETYYQNMEDQEYLDKENEWDFTFFIDEEENIWSGVLIKVGDWTVRFDNVDAKGRAIS